MLATDIVYLPVEINGGAYSTPFIEAVKGGGAWSREARILLSLAAARGVRLNEDDLILEDARDLRARRDEMSR